MKNPFLVKLTAKQDPGWLRNSLGQVRTGLALELGQGKADCADRQKEAAKPLDVTSVLLLFKAVGCSPGTQLPG